MQANKNGQEAHSFSGNIFIFHAFDIGEDINLEKLRQSQAIRVKPFTPSKHFKNYHVPLAVELPESQSSPQCLHSKIHSFGVISLAYKIPFQETLESLRKKINGINAEFQEQSIADANAIFKSIKSFIKQPRFFHLRNSYVVVQLDPQPTSINVIELKDRYGSIIASLLRFETESLSEYQKNEIIDAAMGYYRGDLFIIDIEASFVYDEEYEEIIDIFEFANIQQLELMYFDRTIDQQLSVVYQREVRALPIKAYLPFIGSAGTDPISALNMLKVDISVIIERLESNMKLAGEVYIAEIYSLLEEKLDLPKWKEAIDNKLDIIKDINSVYQDKIDALREDLLSILIIVLIFIELIVGILTYLK